MPRARSSHSASSPANNRTPELSAKKKPARRSARKKFVEVQCHETGYSEGRHNKIFRHRADPAEGRFLEWRNNLTALSQRYNLFLLAGQAQIWAYEPHYPTQHLPEHPQAIVESPQYNPERQGFINPSVPHGINHLVISNLGNDEIVVCACDDGDVYAYLTLQIVDAIRELKSVDAPQQSALVQHIKPFFHQNIRLSAWGLAVHQEARLIAASCNTHDVYVFAFALTSDVPNEVPKGTESLDEVSSDSDSETGMVELPWVRQESFEGWTKHPHPEAFAKRDRNYLVRLSGHGANVPALAFCNTGDDPEGRHLISTDIEGVTIVWDVINGAPERLRRCGHDPRPDGWAVHWLDKRSFRRTDARAAFTDKARYGVFQFDSEFGVVDMSSTRDVHARSAEWDPFAGSSLGQGARAAQESDAEDMVFDMTFNEVDEMEDLILEGDLEEDEEEGGVSFTSSSPPASRQSKLGLIQEPKTLHSGVKEHSALQTWRCHSGWPTPSQVLQARIADDADGPTLPLTPLLIFTADAFVLYQTSLLEHAPRAQPYVLMEEPLVQDGTADALVRLRRMDRMNLTLQIPELGIVLAGSPKGRVGVFSLHQVWPNPFVEMAHNPAFTIRLDKVLPLPAQEAEGKRPFERLVGISASPVQNKELGSRIRDSAVDFNRLEASRRWRVILLYRDHTVISYELSREREVASPAEHGAQRGTGDLNINIPFV